MLKTNKDRLIETAVEGIVQPASGRGFSVMWDGTPKNSIGTASINYTASVGDPVYKWAEATTLSRMLRFREGIKKAPATAH